MTPSADTLRQRSLLAPALALRIASDDAAVAAARPPTAAGRPSTAKRLTSTRTDPLIQRLSTPRVESRKDAPPAAPHFAETTADDKDDDDDEFLLHPSVEALQGAVNDCAMALTSFSTAVASASAEIPLAAVDSLQAPAARLSHAIVEAVGVLNGSRRDKLSVHQSELLQAILQSARACRRRLSRVAVRTMRDAPETVQIRCSRTVAVLSTSLGTIEQGSADSDPEISLETALSECTAHAGKVLFALSKRQEFDAELRDSGTLGVVMELLRTGLRRGGGDEYDSDEVASAVEGKLDWFSFSACATPSLDTLTYLAGVLKNATNHRENAAHVVSLGGVALLAAVVRAGARAVRVRKDEESTKRETMCSNPRAVAGLMVQCVQALRNLAMDRRHWTQFWQAQVVDSTLALFPALRRHHELATAVARVMAKLTLDDEARKRFTLRPVLISRLASLVALHAPTTVAVEAQPVLMMRPPSTLQKVSASVSKANSARPPSKHSDSDSESDDDVTVGGIPSLRGRSTPSKLPLSLPSVPDPSPDRDSPVAPLRAQHAADIPGGSPDPEASAIQRAPLLTRVFFSLGNLTATNDKNRIRIGRTLKFLDPALACLRSYTDLLAAASDRGETREFRDVLVKGFRFLGNLAVNPSVAQAIGSHPAFDVLSRALVLVRASSDSEMMLNAIATLGNVAFASIETATPDSPFLAVATAAIPRLLPLILMHDSQEAQLEAARAVANLGRHPVLKRHLVGSGVVAALLETVGEQLGKSLVMLRAESSNEEDSIDPKVLLTATGGLINLLSDDPGRDQVWGAVTEAPSLISVGGKRHGPDVLIRLVDWTFWDVGDSKLTELALQALFNYVLGWSPGKPSRLNADQVIDCLQLFEGVIEEEDARERGDSDEHGQPLPPPSPVVAELVSRLRDVVRSVAEAGDVSDTVSSAAVLTSEKELLEPLA
jgi:hypothetical protein